MRKSISRTVSFRCNPVIFLLVKVLLIYTVKESGKEKGMRRFLGLWCFFCFFVFLNMVFSNYAPAKIRLPWPKAKGIDLPWSTTYDCPKWDKYSTPLDCDGLEKKR